MKRIMLIVAYDGTNYHGCQFQKTGISIEEVLTNACKSLLDEEVELIGASRTDAGVHALGNVAVFNTKTKIPAEKLSFALNQRLPDDIRVQKSWEVPEDFHPRYTQSEKTYVYTIENQKIGLPTHRLYSYFVYIPLDIPLMRNAATYIEGEHDFQCFCAAGSQVKSTVRTVTRIFIEEECGLIKIRVSGNGFLYNMVRIIAGTLIEVGKGRMEPKYIKDIIKSRERSNAGPTAPAHGLTLEKIRLFADFQP